MFTFIAVVFEFFFYTKYYFMVKNSEVYTSKFKADLMVTLLTIHTSVIVISRTVISFHSNIVPKATITSSG